jgi:hypothetical protein
MSYTTVPMARDRKTYEWDLEACDGAEILEHDFRDALKATDLDDHLFQYTGKSLASATGRTTNLVLVQNIGNDDEGIKDRGWAYVTFDDSGRPKLPELFDNGHNVPKRFQKQLERWADNN